MISPDLVEEKDRTFQAFEPRMWTGRVEGGYGQLGWVGDTALLNMIIQQLDLAGDEEAIDVATGTGAVAKVLAPKVRRVHGIDISPAMLATSKQRMGEKSITLTGADAQLLPFKSESVDVVTARMVYHHLPDVGKAIEESLRVLKPGGKLLVAEYVAANQHVRDFERAVFEIKEIGRHFWTGEELANLIQQSVFELGADCEISLEYEVMPQYSVRDWLLKSGLSQTEQQAIFDIYASADRSIIEQMHMTFIHNKEGANRDILIDRPFAYVKVVKK